MLSMLNVLSLKSFEEIVEAPSKLGDRVLLELYYCTGARNTEIRILRVKDIDLEGKIIRIIDSKKHTPFKIPITERCVKLLEKYMESVSYLPEEPLFRGYGGHPISISLVRYIIKKYNPNFDARMFRRRIARLWVMKKGNLLRLQELLRHTRFSSTSRYIDGIRFEEEEKEARKEYDMIVK